MKLKFIALLVLPLLLSSSKNTPDFWGQTGHRVVGEIAQKHLKPSTKRQLKKLLQQKSLAFVSTFADEIKSDSRYDKFYTWHFINMPLESDYEASEKNPKGDLVSGINYCTSIISDKNATTDDKVFYLKLLVHLIGDLHQPMHIGLLEDKGGNDFKVKWHYKDSNLHRVWDSEMIDTYDMGYIELAKNADVLTKAEVKQIQEGTVIDWVNETHQLTKKVYASVNHDDNLRYSYSYNNLNTVRDQLQIAGVRLAKVLNDLF